MINFWSRAGDGWDVLVMSQMEALIREGTGSRAVWGKLTPESGTGDGRGSEYHD